MATVLVTGATGYIGSRLVCVLARAGHRVIATGRDPAKFDSFDWPDEVHHARLDVSEPSDARSELDRLRVEVGTVDAAYYLVHEIGTDDYADNDVREARGFAEVCCDGGIGRVVYLGGLVPDEELSEHLQSRAAVGRALREAGPELVWLRAAVILGAGSTSFELMRHVVDRLPVVPLPSWTRNEVSPVSVDDVLRYLVAAAEPNVIPPGAYDLGNGETMTYRALVELYARIRGLRRVWVPVIGVPTALAAKIAAAITPVPKALAADLIESLRNTMAADDHLIRELVPTAAGGATGTAQALARAVVPAQLRGVCATADPLQLTDTDPPWAARR